MSEKRFIEPNKECRVIKNTKTGETAIYYDTEDGLMFLKWLNNLSDENEQLKHELETIKNILFDLKEIESYWDGSILQNVIDNIAETVGVDLE